MALNKLLFITFIVLLSLTLFHVSPVKAVDVDYAYEFCESLSGFYVYTPDFHNSSFSVDNKQGIYSLDMCNHTVSSEGYYRVSNLEDSNKLPNGTSAKKVYGFWLQCLSATAPTSDGFTVEDSDNGHLMNVQVDWNEPYSRWDWRIGVLGTGGYTDLHVGSISLGQWYWIEIDYYGNGDVEFFVDGVSKHTFVENVQIDETNNRVWLARTLPGIVGHLRWDYFRLGNYQEYPPSNPKAQLEVDTRNLTNQTLNIPFVLNTSSYNCPYNETVDQATYVMEALEQWNNKTHIYSFVNWSDGVTNPIRTFTLNEDKTFLAYYTIGEKYDPGGWINFGIGLVGLILIFLSWIVLKLKWKDHDYSSAIGYWLLLMVIGICLFTVMVGG